MGRFDGGWSSSDAGGVLLREVDKCIGVTARMSRYFVDCRNPASVEHSVAELVLQRIYAIALGYKTSMTMNDCVAIGCYRCWWASRM